ncbi:HAD-IIIC family phosphatase [Campylobacter vulpis]|uniref:HAD-IIIC family phosphatase n=1 Tax=Campylobacter vulpis TaxID=1655500 RepID=UPI001BCD3B60|nr:HAD-IIIC family phosphatase [Campylobacter vulpis]MBS4235553.1 HAD-IIIC family phosphatase [Campylobacter vulpis]MBS4269511.1 HAD-IIIC family phosphatase [Campylobacter vulpis]
MKNLIIDLDGTLTLDEKNIPYEDKKPNLAFIKQLQNYQKMGFKITIFTSRSMRTFKGDVEKIKTHTYPTILQWLHKHKVPFDDLIVGKAWCGDEGFYVDDKAIRPSEFISLSYEEIQKLLAKESLQCF